MGRAGARTRKCGREEQDVGSKRDKKIKVKGWGKVEGKKKSRARNNKGVWGGGVVALSQLRGWNAGEGIGGEVRGRGRKGDVRFKKADGVDETGRNR